MPNNPPAPEKAPELLPPAGYVLVTKGVVQEGDYCLNRIGPYPDDLEWQRFDSGADLIGMPASHWAAVVRPPQPEPSEREAKLREALKDARDTLGVLLACFTMGVPIGSTQEVMDTITRCSEALGNEEARKALESRERTEAHDVD
jgi:hypothetical protein